MSIPGSDGVFFVDITKYPGLMTDLLEFRCLSCSLAAPPDTRLISSPISFLAPISPRIPIVSMEQPKIDLHPIFGGRFRISRISPFFTRSAPLITPQFFAAIYRERGDFFGIRRLRRNASSISNVLLRARCNRVRRVS